MKRNRIPKSEKTIFSISPMSSPLPSPSSSGKVRCSYVSSSGIRCRSLVVKREKPTLPEGFTSMFGALLGVKMGDASSTTQKHYCSSCSESVRSEINAQLEEFPGVECGSLWVHELSEDELLEEQ